MYRAWMTFTSSLARDARHVFRNDLAAIAVQLVADSVIAFVYSA